MQDPYSILGVSKSATQEDIKKAYRKLAKTYHPDRNPGDKEKEKKFKEISHAFDLIGTEEARAKFEQAEQEQKMYEGFGAGAGRGQAGGFQGYTGGFGDFDTDDIFQSIFGGAGRRRKSGPQSGEDELYHFEVEFKEAVLGAEKLITLPGGKKLQIKIPAGISEGQKLRFKGQGGAGINGGPAGDILIEIQIRPQAGFTRQGNDLLTEVPITFFDALTGAEIEIPTLDGQVLLKVPAGVSTGSKLRIKGKGAGAGESRGNLIAVLKVVTPKNVPEGLREELKSLKQKYNYEPRAS